jgi:hypothetical protein
MEKGLGLRNGQTGRSEGGSDTIMEKYLLGLDKGGT